MTFDKDPVTNRFILQAFENATWLFTTHSHALTVIVKDFDELMNEYLCLD